MHNYDPFGEIQHPQVVGYTKETNPILRFFGWPRYVTYTRVPDAAGGGWDSEYHEELNKESSNDGD